MSQTKSRDIIVLSILVAAALLTVVIPFWSFFEHYVAQIPLPAYPRANNIAIRYENNSRITTFQTLDIPGDVLRFYEIELQKKGLQGDESEEPANSITYMRLIEDKVNY